MELSFQTIEVRDICEKRATATEKLGPIATAALERCLADIDAVETMPELLALFLDAVYLRSPDEQVIALETGHFIVVQSGHAIKPETPTGGTDWDRVTRLKIMAIEEDHD